MHFSQTENTLTCLWRLIMKKSKLFTTANKYLVLGLALTFMLSATGCRRNEEITGTDTQTETSSDAANDNVNDVTNGTENNGTIDNANGDSMLDNAGNAVDDAVDGMTNAVDDIGNGISNATDDVIGNGENNINETTNGTTEIPATNNGTADTTNR